MATLLRWHRDTKRSHAAGRLEYYGPLLLILFIASISLSLSLSIPLSASAQTRLTIDDGTGHKLTQKVQSLSGVSKTVEWPGTTGSSGEVLTSSGANPNVLTWTSVVRDIVGTDGIAVNTDNYAPPLCTILRLAVGTDCELLGMVAGSDGQRITIENTGVGHLSVMNNASATAANKFLTPVMPNGLGMNISIDPQSSLTFRYNILETAWRLESSSR